MQFNNRRLVSPNFANVYVEMSRSDGQLAVLRRAGDGGLHQLAGKAGCLSGSKKSGCTKLGNPTEDTLALSPDGKQAYIASGDENDISIYPRWPGTGALRLQQRCIAYQNTKPCGPNDVGQFISLRMSPDGSSLYLVEGVDDLVVGYARDPSTGSLTKLPAPFGCGRSTPCPDGLAVAESIAFTPDSGTAYYILATGNGSGGGIIVYHHAADGSLTPFAAPFACVAAVATTCQAAPNMRVNEPSMVYQSRRSQRLRRRPGDDHRLRDRWPTRAVSPHPAPPIPLVQSRRTASWAAPTPWPVAAPALLASRVAWAALATGSGVLGAHMPSSNTVPVCGLPIANTVAAVPAALNEVEM